MSLELGYFVVRGLIEVAIAAPELVIGTVGQVAISAKDLAVEVASDVVAETIRATKEKLK